MPGPILSEQDIRTKRITPAIARAGWDLETQLREEVTFTAGRIIVRGKMVARGKQQRADYVLYHRAHLPLAIVEAKDDSHAIGAGIQQALAYAEALDAPFAFSSNGAGFLFRDRTGLAEKPEVELAIDEFPSPEELWRRYRQWKGWDEASERVATQPYHADAGGKAPRYYQENVINRAVDAIARGQKRVLLVMATGTGKTYVAFQIIWRLWKSRTKRRILFLADRNILVDQTKSNDFKPFGTVMTKITLPPLPEQHRIVAKVDELMALCDQLEARLTRARATSEALASSATHHLVSARELPAGNCSVRQNDPREK